jgi:hypothetical protein
VLSTPTHLPPHPHAPHPAFAALLHTTTAPQTCPLPPSDAACVPVSAWCCVCGLCVHQPRAQLLHASPATRLRRRRDGGVCRLRVWSFVRVRAHACALRVSVRPRLVGLDRMHVTPAHPHHRAHACPPATRTRCRPPASLPLHEAEGISNLWPLAHLHTGDHRPHPRPSARPRPHPCADHQPIPGAQGVCVCVLMIHALVFESGAKVGDAWCHGAICAVSLGAMLMLFAVCLCVCLVCLCVCTG